MKKLASVKNMVTTIMLLLTVVPAVDAGSSESNMDRIDHSHLNKHVKLFVKSYLRENSINLYSIKKRSSSPFFVIDSVFKLYGLPAQLKYLAVVESDLKTKAISKAGAVGPWQLMPTTARILGLTVNSRMDERKNYYKSTKAAARYLKDLHDEYGDWLLVFAAYNSGEGPVNSAIKLSGTRNFWKLQAYLPEETREYVEKFIATCYYFESTYTPSLFSLHG